jgi:undecaprenyl diphosphate synthase
MSRKYPIYEMCRNAIQNWILSVSRVPQQLHSIPEHIAIIPDGNRRWARRRGLPAMMGHAQGAIALEKVISAAAEFGIKIVTLYAFSTENWSRPQEEVNTLLELFTTNLISLRDKMVAQDVKLAAIGDLSRFPETLLRELTNTLRATQNGQKIELVLAMNYGGRDEICRAAEKIVEAVIDKKMSFTHITEELFAQNLDTAQWRDPELFIRTSGERRLSNFLLWQLSYAEVYTTEVLWPDFDREELRHALIDFQKRERRLGT